MWSRIDPLEWVLFEEVVQHPEDELALHVYADWLLEQGDRAAQSRGEHIKVELELAREHRPAEVRELRWQAHDLWWNHGAAWLGPLYDAVDHFVVDRGRLCIEISEATFKGVSPDEIAAAPAWRRVTDVVFRDCGLGFLRFLRQLPRPPHLAEVELPPRTLHPSEVHELFGGVLWDGLRGLKLRGNVLEDAGAAALAAWPGAVSLRRLDLEETWIGPDGAAALGRSPWLTGLDWLSLKRNALDRHTLVVVRADGSAVEVTTRQFLRERFGGRVKFH